MRNLLIKRERAFAGCFGKMKVYLQDPDKPELTIKGCPCRKLGELKNGEEKTFEIPEESVWVFVIGDAATKDFCVDGKLIPSGSGEVHLKGKTVMDPEKGNPFRFDKE